MQKGCVYNVINRSKAQLIDLIWFEIQDYSVSKLDAIGIMCVNLLKPLMQIICNVSKSYYQTSFKI